MKLQITHFLLYCKPNQMLIFLVFKIMKLERACSKVWLPCMVGASNTPLASITACKSPVTYFILHIWHSQYNCFNFCNLFIF